MRASERVAVKFASVVVQPVPVMDVATKPVGKKLVMVTAPLEAALPTLVTVMV